MMNTEVSKEQPAKMSVSERAKFFETVGVKCGKMFNATMKKANKILNPLGYEVSIELIYKELPKEK